MTKKFPFNDGTDDVPLRLIATIPIWMLRAAVGGVAGVRMFVLVLAVDGLLILGTWIAIAPSVRSNSEVGNPASGERFVLLPLVLAGVLTLFDLFP